MIDATPERVSNGLQVEVEHDGEVMLVRVRGELDVGTVPSLVDCVDDASGPSTRRVIIDLGQVTFFDSSAVRQMVAMQRQLAGQNRHFVLANPSSIVRRVLEICGLSGQFEVAPANSASTAATDGGSAEA